MARHVSTGTMLFFIEAMKPAPARSLACLLEHEVPDGPGVYLLMAQGRFRFPYPRGASAIYYIGQARSLRRRLLKHHKFVCEARDSRRLLLYWPRYEYAAVVGARYSFVRTWQGVAPKALEDTVMAHFARHFGCWPVANGACAWNRLERILGLPSQAAGTY
jgi:hypothetical protein